MMRALSGAALMIALAAAGCDKPKPPEAPAKAESQTAPAAAADLQALLGVAAPGLLGSESEPDMRVTVEPGKIAIAMQGAVTQTTDAKAAKPIDPAALTLDMVKSLAPGAYAADPKAIEAAIAPPVKGAVQVTEGGWTMLLISAANSLTMIEESQADPPTVRSLKPAQPWQAPAEVDYSAPPR